MGSAEGRLKVSVSGLRGVLGQTLTPEVMARFTAAFLRQILREERNAGGDRRRRLVMGRDGRLGSELVCELAGATARAAGFDVVDLGVAMTPTVGVMTLHHGAAGGLVATASHNPQQWCGLKPITSQGRAPGPRESAALVECFERGLPVGDWAPATALGQRDADDTAAHVHVARCLAALEPICSIEEIKQRGLRVAVDSVNASGASGARLLLDALGCDALLINSDPTGVFAHPPEPAPENLSQLCEVVKERGCDAGFAQDPDGDRLALVDGQGACIGEEKTLALAVRAVLSSLDGANGAIVATNQSTSRMIEDVAAEFGAQVVRSPVGEAHVVNAMLERGAAIGGEGNGGVIWPEVALIRDSLSAMTLTLALIARERKPLRELAAGLPGYAMIKRKAPMPADAQAALERVAGAFDGARVDRSDGVRVDLPEKRAWLHVRASNTEPIIRFIAEAPREDDAASLIAQAEAALRKRGG